MSHKIDYLRLSVTDRCNLRCSYCMPRDGILYKPHGEILTFEEIVRLVKIFVNLGIDKIRLTGGESLVRKGIVMLVRYLAGIEGIERLSLTTNGVLLPLYAKALKKSGLKAVNISLDTLKEDRFRAITGRDGLYHVLEGIKKAKDVGFHPLKLNMVVMKGINDDEIIDFVDFASSRGLTVRFIEFMKVTPLWKEEYYLPVEEIIKICDTHFSLEDLGTPGPGPAHYYRTARGDVLGFIKTDPANCTACSRVRLTSTGELKRCLYESGGLSLRWLLRNGFSDRAIRDSIDTQIRTKYFADYRSYSHAFSSYMCSIGG